MAKEKTELHRHIGLTALILYGVGDILGAGVYGLIGKAAGQMGNAVWIAFLTSMVAAGLTGLSYASLGSRYPRAGGAAFVTHRAYKKSWLAYMVGLAVLASGLTSMGAATRAFSGYFQGLFPMLPLPVIMLGFMGLVTFIVFWGIKESMWANSVCTIIELTGLAVVIIAGISYIGSVDLMDARVPTNPSGDLSIALVLSGAVLTFYSFVGFEDILNVGEEVKNPKRTLPIGLISAVAIASLIYMTVSIVSVSVLPAEQLSASKEPLVDVVRTAAPWFNSGLFSIIAMFAVANTALLNFIMGSRLIFGMSRDGLLPTPLAKVHSKRHTPYIAIIAVASILCLLAFIGDISQLAKATSVLLLTCFTLVNIALVILKSRKNEPKGSFEIPTFVPILGAMICMAMLMSAKAPELKMAGGILVGIGILYAIMRPNPKLIESLDEA